MSLTDEKKRLKEAAIKLSPLYGTFEKTDEADSSYYKEYASCKHFDTDISCYTSDEISDLRSMLLQLWDEDEELKKAVIPILLAAYVKTKDSTENYLEEIDLMNYML